MNRIKLTREYEHLKSKYRITYSEFSDTVIVEKLTPYNWLRSYFKGEDLYWKPIYSGPIALFKKVVETYNHGRDAASKPKLK